MSLPDLTQATLSPKQLYSLGSSNGRVNLWDGAIRSGKTFVSVLRWLIFIAFAPAAGELVMVGKSRDSLYRNVIAPLQKNPEWAFIRWAVRYKYGATTARIFGRTVHVMGASDNTSEGRIRGMTVCGAYVDELTLLPASFFKQLLGRMSVEGAQLFATTNPDSPAHWLKTEYLDKLPDDWTRFHFLLEDNLTLSPGYIRSIKREYTGLWYKRFILGLWVAAEGAIYNMWDPDVHVVPWEDMPTVTRLFSVGMDFGATNASTGLLLGLTKEVSPAGVFGKRLILVDEWRYDSRVTGRTMSPSQQALDFKRWLKAPHFPDDRPELALKPEWVVVDPAARPFRDELNKRGVRTWQAVNDVQRGISMMANLLVEQRLIVSDRCAGFINEAPGYAWDPKASEQGHDEPVKTADHSLDGARYAIATTEQMWERQIHWPDVA